jgi:Fic family protein
MTPDEILEIWPSKTGILDLPAEAEALPLPSMDRLRSEWALRRKEVVDREVLEVFANQLQREWAIETGQIENLYSIERGVTETLIEQGFSAALLPHGSTDKPTAEVLALITDQQNALQGLFDFVKQDRPLSTGYIKELHAAMTQSQPTTEAIDPQGNRTEVPLLRGEWKRHQNYPRRDGKIYRYCPPEQTQSEMERLVAMHLGHQVVGIPSEVEAAWLHHRFTQIHPFQDGNGRVARALASLVLIRAEMFPLIVPMLEKQTYLESLERADQGNLKSLILLVGRRQQIEFQKAVDLFSKITPVAETYESELNNFNRYVANSDSSRTVRLKARAESVIQVASVYLNARLDTLAQSLRQARPGNVRGNFIVSPLTDAEASFDGITKQIPGKLEGPFYHAYATLNVPFPWKVEVVAFGASNSPEEALLLAFTYASDKTDANLIAALEVGQDHYGFDLEDKVGPYIEEALSKVLFRIRSGELT